MRHGLAGVDSVYFHDHLMTARRRGEGREGGREGIILFIFSCFKSDVGF